MLWYFKQVEKLKEKYNAQETVETEEVKKLQRYVNLKKSFLSKPGTEKGQFYKADNLLKQIRDDRNA